MKTDTATANEVSDASYSLSRVARRLGAVLGFALFSIALWIIYREIKKMGLGQIVTDLHAMPRSSIFWAAVLTALSYWLLTGYEVLGFRNIGHRINYFKIILAAFIGYSFSNNISMTPSVAVRYRMYSTWGVSKVELTKLVIFHMLGTWLGFLFVGGLVLLIEPPYGRKDVAPRMLRIPGQKDITNGSSIRRFQESSRSKVS